MYDGQPDILLRSIFRSQFCTFGIIELNKFDYKFDNNDSLTCEKDLT